MLCTGIGCILETILQLLIVFIVAVLMGVSFAVHQTNIALVLMLLLNLCPYIMGLLTLYFPIYFIHKFEHAAVDDHSEITEMTQQNQMETDQNLKNVIVLENTTLEFHKFLNEYENYKAFKQYTIHCWAIENLLFVQYVSILYQTILKYAKNSDTTNGINDRHSNMGLVTFQYLETIYESLQQQIDVVPSEKQRSFSDLKTVLFQICGDIYWEFIHEGSLNQINISHDARMLLSDVS